MAKPLETIRRGHEAFNRDDLSALEELTVEDVDWGATGAFPGVDPSYRGPAAIREWSDAIRGEWREFEVSIGEVLHEAKDLLVVSEHLRGRGRTSGIEVEMSVFSVYWFDERARITRRSAFTDRQEALKAAGASA